MSRCAAAVLSLGILFQLSHGLEVNVTKDGKLCLYANLMINFSVSYEGKDNKTHTATFELPPTANPDDSKCDETASTLTLKFGEGHSWSMDFSKKDAFYQADNVTFTYNLSDSTTFPNSASNETRNVTAKPQITEVVQDTCYSCRSTDTIEAPMVNMTLWNVLMQAFVINGSKSGTISPCDADKSTTSAPPTTHATNATTVAPTTNGTTPAPIPTTTPTPTLPTPSDGTYMLKADENSTACLLANFGLRIRFEQGGQFQEMNLEPNLTKASGFCGVNSSELVLESAAMTINFTFTNDTKKFHLHALNVTAKTGSGEFTDVNTNMSVWEAAVGSSYMCNKEQNYTITKQLTLYTFNLRVQPFGVKKGGFSTAEDCLGDAESFLVPIAVGVALLVLILIVLLAYFIGRRRNMATGYESF
ncbi:lysosome-associated membrane glycoprotein 2 isoform X2 [Cololabis saira]|uniref:lysosome-associated membrane glycoprotein 2 isoform X2 n=1 Tax=Cololabis saira TaxID=129043 RepID=UPI002AD222E0|nr:lysosome-associated membrane glycoprotein 2 isoform X2 [Cololabis saira]